MIGRNFCCWPFQLRHELPTRAWKVGATAMDLPLPGKLLIWVYPGCLADNTVGDYKHR